MDQIAPSMNTILKNQKIEIIADAEAMSRAAAELLIEHIAESLHTQEVHSIALSGGATPRRLYALLADDRDLRRQIPWERIHFFWGDERHVPPDHPDSNYRMADTALLSKVPVPKANIHRIPAENPDAAKAAADYDLIVLGASREGVFSSVLFGEIPEKIARYSQTPVMIVKRYEGPVKSIVKRVLG